MNTKLRYEWALAAAVFLAAACVAFAYLQTQVHTAVKERSISARAVMVGSGRGFGMPEESQIPGLSDFLDRRTPSFDPGCLPARLSLSNSESVGAYHRYLVYALGLTWRLCGISWLAATCFEAALFGATIAIGYGLLRLGVSRPLSLLGALLFMMSPAMLMAVPDIRDFSKAPFVLGAVLIMGRLAKGPVKPAAYWGAAALLGVVIGVGMGFRQDVLICFPPAVLVVTVLAQGASRLSIPRRLAAGVLLLSGFLATAWPMLTQMDRGGAQPYHPIVFGLGTEPRDNLSLRPAGYDPITLSTDDYTFATLASYDARLNGEAGLMTYNSARAVQVGKRWLLEVARTFPADVVTRAYAALLWAMGDGGAQFLPALTPGDWTSKILLAARPISVHLYQYGIWYLAVALAILSSRSVRQAGVVLFFLVYFCGYVSLDFQYRHVFHLCFVPVWILVFLIGALGKGSRALMCAQSRKQVVAVLADPRRWWAAPTKRIVVFCMGACLVLFAPLEAARAYQHAVVGGLLPRYAAAALEPVETTQEAQPVSDWTLFRPANPDASLAPWVCGFKEWAFYAASWCTMHDLACTPVGAELGTRFVNLLASVAQLVRPRMWETHTGYLVAELTATNKERLLLLKYASGNPSTDFSQLVTVAPAAGGTVKYFFPIYELCTEKSGARDWNRFIGVALPREQAAAMKGLYRVKDLEAFRILVNLTLPEDEASFARYQSIVRHAGLLHRNACADNPFGWAARGKAKWDAGEKDEALMLYRAALALDPRCAVVCAEMGTLLAQDGEVDAAAYAFETAICEDPEFSPAYFQLDTLLQSRNDPAGRTEVWRRIADQYPDAAFVHINLAGALDAQGRFEEAVQMYRKAAAADPRNSATQAMLGQALVRTGAYAEAIPVLEDLFEHHPESDPFRWALVKALTETGQYNAAWEEVGVCRTRGVWLPPELIQVLEQKSGRANPPS